MSNNQSKTAQNAQNIQPKKYSKVSNFQATPKKDLDYKIGSSGIINRSGKLGQKYNKKLDDKHNSAAASSDKFTSNNKTDMSSAKDGDAFVQKKPIIEYISLLIFLIGLCVFYFTKIHIGWKWLSFLTGLFVSVGLFGFLSPSGKKLQEYFINSWREAKKIAWPTKKETVQFGWIVLVFVLILGLLIWLIDSGLSLLIYDVILK